MTGLSLVQETQYNRLVREGRAARERADNVQWTEGDLALQVETLKGNERPRDENGEFLADASKALRRYAEDIDVNYSTLQGYRRTAEVWPPPRRRGGVGFEVHKALNAAEDRFALIRDDMTLRQAEDIIRKRRAATSGKPGWHELIGRVGDALLDAEKHMTKVEDAITREPDDSVIEKAEKYAEWAEALALRLHGLGDAA